MATKAQRAAEKARTVGAAVGRVKLCGDGAVLFLEDAKITKAPDCYWVQAWVRVPLEAAQEKKGK